MMFIIAISIDLMSSSNIESVIQEIMDICDIPQEHLGESTEPKWNR